ncbi:hypothetical protein [uncultured Haemophilus sp.]|uniref:hypothetical protein n=1 Tax=uncultured Haemophilus sp. TaxID=237779 RepID=UPI0028053B8C|nr:hypothetical protein [uncultured Haemophilus sp.]
MAVKFNAEGFATTSGEITVYTTDYQGIYSHATTEFVSEGGSLAAGSYLDAPPPGKEGFVVVRAENGWSYQADNRGIYYRTDTGEKVEYLKLGDIPGNLTKIEPLNLPCKWDGENWVVDTTKQAELYANAASRLVDGIDSKAAEIYKYWTRFESEYRERQAAANAFKSAGYQGEVSRYIADFARHAGIDNKTATDLILVQAEGLEKLQMELANQRMRKYEIKAPNLTLDQMQAIYDDIILTMDKLLEAYKNG